MANPNRLAAIKSAINPAYALNAAKKGTPGTNALFQDLASRGNGLLSALAQQGGTAFILDGGTQGRGAAPISAPQGSPQAAPQSAPVAMPTMPVAPKLDARVQFGSILESYGFNTAQANSLVGEIDGWTKQGYDPSTIASALIPKSKAYKERFVANDARVKAGMGALSPAEYIQQESAYRQVLSFYNLPPGFYDQQSDFASWIANDVSVDEISSRAKGASQIANSVDGEMLSQFQAFYGVGKGDLTAYFLDRTNAVAVLEKRAAAAQIGGEALRNNLQIGREYSEKIVDLGISQEASRQVFNEAGQTKDELAKLAQLDRKTLTTKEITDTGFGLDAQAAKKLTGLKSSERSRFAGSSGGLESLNRNTSGSI